MKIFITGISGGGKTTLAKKLSFFLKISSFDLDDIFWI
jgi:adenylate kinase family enzyme